MNFKESISEDDIACVDDVYYDLFDGGYIKPEKFLADKESIAEVQWAIATIEDFLNGCQRRGYVEIL